MNETNAMLSLVYQDMQQLESIGQPIDLAFWDAIIALVQVGKIHTYYDDDDGSIKYIHSQQ